MVCIAEVKGDSHGRVPIRAMMSTRVRARAGDRVRVRVRATARIGIRVLNSS